jgi:hypothetical protein
VVDHDREDNQGAQYQGKPERLIVVHGVGLPGAPTLDLADVSEYA